MDLTLSVVQHVLMATTLILQAVFSIVTNVIQVAPHAMVLLQLNASLVQDLTSFIHQTQLVNHRATRLEDTSHLTLEQLAMNVTPPAQLVHQDIQLPVFLAKAH